MMELQAGFRASAAVEHRWYRGSGFSPKMFAVTFFLSIKLDSFNLVSAESRATATSAPALQDEWTGVDCPATSCCPVWCLYSHNNLSPLSKNMQAETLNGRPWIWAVISFHFFPLCKQVVFPRLFFLFLAPTSTFAASGPSFTLSWPVIITRTEDFV